MITFFAIDRSPYVVSGRKHPAIMAWHSRVSRDGFVQATPAAHKATKREAEVLCKEWYGVTLTEALRKCLI